MSDKDKNIDDAPEKEAGMDDAANTSENTQKKPRRHLIKNTFLRRLLKTLMWIIIVILLLPVLLYIPPVQTFVKNVACNIVSKSTGMKIEIDKFRLKFPLDVSLQGVTVLDQQKDTMVRAKEVIADVRLLPLLDLDIRLNRLRLLEGYYRMVSPDSSMIMKISAGLLDVDNKSSFSIAGSELNLNKALLRDGDLQLYMNVWKQKPTPSDSSASTPFVIKANDIRMENFRFGMSMLPTIDTLSLRASTIELKKGVVDLQKNMVSWQRASVADGGATYLTPTPEYIATHPAPPSQPSSGPPMVIKGDSISLDRFEALYAVKNAKPLPGFDPSYIKVTDVAIGMRDFYNESSTVRLPITRLTARERSGLIISRGSGTIGVDSVGLSLEKLSVATPYSVIDATATIPFALMALAPNAPLNLKASGRVGMPDVEAFMPTLKEYTAMLPARNPLQFAVEANGTLSSVEIPKLNVELREILALNAEGYADNPMDIDKLHARVEFDGSLSDPRLIDKFTGESGIKVPAFTIEGVAEANRGTYGADFSLESTAGDVSGEGSVSINSERYDVSAHLSGVDVAHFVPDLGIGHVTASLRASGAGFNPVSGHAVTDTEIEIASIEYNKKLLKDIRAHIQLLHDGGFTLYAVSANPGLDLEVDGSGTIALDDYTFDISARLRDIDLQALGLSETMNNGSGNISLQGSASPEKWLYQADLRMSDFNWNLPNQYIHLPGGLTAHVSALAESTSLDVNSNMTSLAFESPTGLKQVVDRFTIVADSIGHQIASRNLEIDKLNKALPPFTLNMNASGRGLLSQFLTPMGMSIDTVYGTFSNDTLLSGSIMARNFANATLKLDTISALFNQRRNLLDYKLHVGNRPGTLDEFARINLNGYLGSNRLAASLTQKNIKGETGYRIGLTAAFMDSTINVHFTPLRSTIAYLPWTFNDDNFVEYGLYDKRIQADLRASSAESSVLLRTEPLATGGDELHMKIDNLKIQDFLRMSVYAPPITGAVNSDLRVRYDGKNLSGAGSLGVNRFTYNKTMIGDFDLLLKAGMEADGDAGVEAALKVNNEPALSAFASLRNDSTGFVPDSLGVRLTRFPLKVANPFLDNMVVLGGRLNGEVLMAGSFEKPRFNGHVDFDSVSARIPMAGAVLKFAEDSVTVHDNLVAFDKFKIWGANNNPLILDGTVNADDLSNIAFNLTLNGNNFQAIGNSRKSGSDLYGKLFFNLDASVKGPMNHFDVKANLNILGTTDLTYNLGATPTEFTSQTDNDVVKFVNLNDTTSVNKDDMVSSGAVMRVIASLQISPGTQATVILSSNGTDRVELEPTASLNYFQNFMGDMRLNGNVTLGNGFVRYSIPVIGEKMFTFNPTSSIIWNGDIMNPTLNVTATDVLKANATQGSNSRLVNFIVTLKATNTLSRPDIRFDLSTDDDMSIQNELQSMSADQRQTQAMNLLLYGQYTGQNMKANANLSGNMLYSFLESQLNSIASKYVKGVDLSFGIDQYDKMTNGASSTETSYSYQVSKSLFNNRFKILVGGNYSTDASADENLSQNLISDVSMEYILKQTQTLNMSVRLFRHTGFESILEGEITEMGVGFVMKRKLQNLRSLFRFRRRKRKEVVPDSVMNVADTVTGVNASMRKEEKDDNK